MPFGGRPSASCEPCRKGRLRCDRIRPSCTQCLRKSIACVGYRNVSLLLFKDESESTARKVQWEKNGVLYPQTLPKQKVELELLTVPNRNAIDTVTSLSYSLTPSPSELAVGYFMSSYIPASPFEYLPEIYNSIASTEQGGVPTTVRDAISSTVLAASFASLSMRVGSDKFMNDARIHYSQALIRTNAALASPNTAILDSSLLSVLLLGLYEAIAFSGRRSPTSWTAHTLGAVELIRLRGTKQFETELGKRLFMQTCGNIRSSCIQRGVAVPDKFLQLYEQARPFLDPSIPRVRAGPLIDKLASFKVRVFQNHRAQFIPGIIHEALQLDKEARALEDMLQDDWRFQVTPMHKAPPCAYQGIGHQYAAHRVARHWNILRISRLFLNEVVLRMAVFVAGAMEKGMHDIIQHCKDLDTAALKATAMANGTQLITDILSSATQFLDDTGTTFLPAARFLIWPLTVVLQLVLASEQARQYAIKCLYDIASQAKIPQALQAARAIESGSSLDWMHLYVLG